MANLEGGAASRGWCQFLRTRPNVLLIAAPGAVTSQMHNPLRGTVDRKGG